MIKLFWGKSLPPPIYNAIMKWLSVNRNTSTLYYFSIEIAKESTIPSNTHRIISVIRLLPEIAM